MLHHQIEPPTQNTRSLLGRTSAPFWPRCLSRPNGLPGIFGVHIRHIGKMLSIGWIGYREPITRTGLDPFAVDMGAFAQQCRVCQSDSHHIPHRRESTLSKQIAFNHIPDKRSIVVNRNTLVTVFPAFQVPVLQ